MSCRLLRATNIPVLGLNTAVPVLVVVRSHPVCVLLTVVPVGHVTQDVVAVLKYCVEEHGTQELVLELNCAIVQLHVVALTEGAGIEFVGQT